MDYYYPMSMEEEVHQHPGLLAVQLPWQWRLFAHLSSPAALQRPRRPANHVSWEETAAAHLFSASLPGNMLCSAAEAAFFSHLVSA